MPTIRTPEPTSTRAYDSAGPADTSPIYKAEQGLASSLAGLGESMAKIGVMQAKAKAETAASLLKDQIEQEKIAEQNLLRKNYGAALKEYNEKRLAISQNGITEDTTKQVTQLQLEYRQKLWDISVNTPIVRSNREDIAAIYGLALSEIDKRGLVSTKIQENGHGVYFDELSGEVIVSDLMSPEEQMMDLWKGDFSKDWLDYNALKEAGKDDEADAIARGVAATVQARKNIEFMLGLEAKTLANSKVQKELTAVDKDAAENERIKLVNDKILELYENFESIAKDNLELDPNYDMAAHAERFFNNGQKLISAALPYLPQESARLNILQNSLSAMRDDFKSRDKLYSTKREYEQKHFENALTVETAISGMDYGTQVWLGLAQKAGNSSLEYGSLLRSLPRNPMARDVLQSVQLDESGVRKDIKSFQSTMEGAQRGLNLVGSTKITPEKQVEIRKNVVDSVSPLLSETFTSLVEWDKFFNNPKKTPQPMNTFVCRLEMLNGIYTDPNFRSVAKNLPAEDKADLVTVTQAILAKLQTFKTYKASKQTLDLFYQDKGINTEQELNSFIVELSTTQNRE